MVSCAVRGNHEKHDVVDDLLVRQALREHEGDHVAGRRALPALQLAPPLLDDPSDGVPPAAARREAPAVGGEGKVCYTVIQILVGVIWVWPIKYFSYS